MCIRDRPSGDTIKKSGCPSGCREEGDDMKAAGIPINRGMALAPARVVPPWPVFSDEKREFHTPKERQIASVQNAVSSLSAFYTESANNFYAIGDNTRGDIMVVPVSYTHLDSQIQVIFEKAA